MIWPPELVNDARAMALTGYHARLIARKLAVRFSAEHIPDPATVFRWLREWRQDPEFQRLQQEAIEQAERDIPLRTDELIHAKLDRISDQDDPDHLKRLDKTSFMELNVVGGTYRDKPIRRAESKVSVNVWANLYTLVQQLRVEPAAVDVNLSLAPGEAMDMKPAAVELEPGGGTVMIDSRPHNSYLCPPHVGDCSCPDKATYVCNPYCVLGYCPTDGEEENCQADPTRLKVVPAGVGFTYTVEETGNLPRVSGNEDNTPAREKRKKGRGKSVVPHA